MNTEQNTTTLLSRTATDPRLDPRIRSRFASIPTGIEKPSVGSREELLAQELSVEGLAANELQNKLYDTMDNEIIAPSDGLITRTESFVSSPDGNEVQIQYIRPDNDKILPCIYYIHGGRMAFSSCFLGNYKTWGRMIAAKGLAVAMVDFRNSVHASSAPQIAPFPAGLNDCVSGLKWVYANAASLNIDPAQITVAGESGGANLAFALAMKLKQENSIGLIRGIYGMCPYIAGEWPLPQNPSSTENEGILITTHDNRSTMAYGIEAFNMRNPLAWPGMATVEDVRDFPPTVVSVNECDPLRDEGIAFYRLLLEAGVRARGRMLLGTCHGIEILPVLCPDVAHSTASDIANFAFNG